MRHKKTIFQSIIGSAIFIFLVGCGATNAELAAELVPEAGGAALGVISDWVWIDDNEDGLQNDGEVGLHDVPVQLFDADEDTLVATTLTDFKGAYSFVGIGSGSYYIKFKSQDYLGFTQQDVGADDGLDSDAAKSTGRTAVFVYTTGDLETKWDAGVLVESWDGCEECHSRPTKTPRPTKEPPLTPTPTATPWRVITHGGKREVTMSFGASSGNCSAGDPFADLIEIIIGDDLSTLEFHQPSTGQRNTGTLAEDGTFEIQSADGAETYSGQFNEDGSGTGLNTYVYQTCTWETPIEWTPVDGD